MVLDLSLEASERLVGLVTLDSTDDELVSGCRLYEVGRRRPPAGLEDDDDDDDRDGEDEEEEVRAQGGGGGGHSGWLGRARGQAAAAWGDTRFRVMCHAWCVGVEPRRTSAGFFTASLRLHSMKPRTNVAQAWPATNEA